MNFFGKYFKISLLILFFVELFSFLSFQSDVLSLIIFVNISILVLIVSFYNPKYGLLLALGELIVGSKGNLFLLNIGSNDMSIRKIIFAYVILGWLFHLVRRRKSFVLKNFASKGLMALGIFVVWGLVMAFISKNSIGSIYHDINSWIFFLYAVVFFDYVREYKFVKKIYQVLTAGIAWVCLKSLALLFIFSHTLPNMEVIYQWVRKSGFGEITLLSGNFYRIFSQSQIYVLIGLAIFTGYLLFKNKIEWKWHDTGVYALILLCLATTLLSLSRSNWVGLLFGGLFALIFGIFKFKLGWKKISLFILTTIGTAVLSIGLIAVIVYFPYPNSANIDAGSMLKERIQTDEAAAASRWSQLPNLGRELVKHPILGSGWGTTVTYISQDPRILETSKTGEYTTYAFEWGYLDIMLKIGLAGLLVYLYTIYALSKIGWKLLDCKLTENKALIAGLLLGVVVLVATHGFSPYLNHPLGIGYILLTISLISFYKNNNKYLKQ